MSPKARKLFTRAQIAASLLCVAAAVGCGTFDRDWKAAVVRPVVPSSLEGAWQGTWLSHTNGHSGGLRAIITRNATGSYETRFHATYWKIFSGQYTVTLDAKPAGDGFHLEGREDLGTIFLWYKLGEYSYDGRATGTEFKCTYRSESDGGVFEMTRPK